MGPMQSKDVPSKEACFMRYCSKTHNTMVAASLKLFISLLLEAGLSLYIGENPEEA
jgi:hypothetical protein